MIIWLNGAFGSGKTHTAYELQRRLPNAFVYDPEHTGRFIRENLPLSMNEDDFQEYSMWRTFNFAMLDYLAEGYEGDIIVPMTITNPRYYDELIGALSKKYDVKHFILYADKETLLKRLASRMEGKHSWAALQMDRCIQAFDKDITGCMIHTSGMSLYQVVEEVALLSGKTLEKDNRGRIHKFFDRMVIRLKHINR
ncbi:MAG: AAA family ATPase [Clostridiales bacterium]|nr:AAA family ATPase [Clostridiales bacterium]